MTVHAGKPAEVFRVQLTMVVHPGKEEEFEKVWLSAGDVITSHPANLGQTLLRSAEAPGTFVITSDWVNETLFREYEGSQAHIEHRGLLHPLRASGSMTTLTVLHHRPGAAA
jgi:heme-degrading monooxygenase HmoA